MESTNIQLIQLPTSIEDAKVFTEADVAKHNRKEDCWIVLGTNKILLL